MIARQNRFRSATLLRQSFAYFAVRAVNGVIALLSLFVLTRLMSSEQYGLYALGLAAVNIAAAVLFQGLGVATARFWPAHAASPAALHGEARRVFLSITALFLVASATAVGLAAVGQWSALIVAAVFCGAVAMGLHALNLQLANVKGQARRYAKLTASRAALTLVFAASLVAIGYGAVGALFATTLGALVAVALFGIERLGGQHRAQDPALRRQLLRYAGPLSAVFVAMMVLDQADRFLIAWWYGPSKVAGYAAAYDLTQQSVGAILNVCFLAGFPRVVTAWEAGGPEAARQALRPLSRLVLLLAPLAAALLMAFAPEISSFMFGSSLHDDAAATMPWIAAAVALLGLRAYVFDIAFHVVKATRPLLVIGVLMAAISLAANLALLPSWGVVGAGVAAALAAAAGTLASWWFGRRRGIYPPIGVELLKGLAAGAALLGAAKGPWWSDAVTAGLADTTGQTLVGFARVAVGLSAFAIVAYFCDLSGLRGWLRAHRTP